MSDNTQLTKGFRCMIKDRWGIHNGFWLNLRPGYTALVGPNGAGKTTLLNQVEDAARERGATVFLYSNLLQGGQKAIDMNLEEGKMSIVARLACGSEGEQVAINFENNVFKIGQAVRKAIKENKALFILLDSLDSGASIDKLRELMEFFNMIERDSGIMPGGARHSIYILAAVNQYEMATRTCVDVRTGENKIFRSYTEYADFIANYFQTPGHQPASKPKSNGRGTRRAQPQKQTAESEG